MSSLYSQLPLKIDICCFIFTYRKEIKKQLLKSLYQKINLNHYTKNQHNKIVKPLSLKPTLKLPTILKTPDLLSLITSRFSVIILKALYYIFRSVKVIKKLIIIKIKTIRIII